jgi:hypothetical protein
VIFSTTMRRIGMVAVLVTSLTAVSCSSERAGEEWVRFRAPEAINSAWEALPPNRIHEVPPDVLDEAIASLATEAGRLLSEQEVRRFLRAEVPNLARRWYLLRAVRTPTGNGEYHVLTRGRAVVVRYEASSKSNRTVKSAIVVDLDESPDSLYVEISAGQ